MTSMTNTTTSEHDTATVDATDNDTDDGAAERALFARYRQTHDSALRDHLILAQRPWVRKVARRYHAPGWEYADLEQTGMLGVLAAMDRYDPESGYRFKTLAEFYVRGAIREAIQPEINSSLSASASADITEQDTMPLPLYSVSYTSPAWLQDRITRELETLPTPGPTLEEQVAARIDGPAVSAVLSAALDRLSARERFVITRRFGLVVDGNAESDGYTDDGVCWTAEAVGRAPEIRRCRRTVLRIQQRALTTLREHLLAQSNGALALRHLDEVQARRRTRRRGQQRAAA